MRTTQTMMVSRTTLVIPCYNEAGRLDRRSLSKLLDEPCIDLLFVNDGSTDATHTILEQFMREHPKRVGVLALESNQGKAEAVRRGLTTALTADNTDVVGYLDADLATPAPEVHRLVQVLRDRDVQVLLGARVSILGRAIERSPLRHYLGRVFATLASMTLRLPAYDTQCGAKLFRVTPPLAHALDEPFLSRWAFDVELIGRLLVGSPSVPGIAPTQLWEEPLYAWRDVKGSKLAPLQMGKTLLDLARIDRDLARRRTLVAAHPPRVPTAEAVPISHARSN